MTDLGIIGGSNFYVGLARLVAQGRHIRGCGNGCVSSHNSRAAMT